MSESDEQPKCPHCDEPLSQWAVPPDSTWHTGFQWVCFSEECPYYVKGWEHMKVNYAQKASYRYRYNPGNDEHGPLPVWSPDAHRDRIIEKDNTP